jgi:hypothetical protein
LLQKLRYRDKLISAGETQVVSRKKAISDSLVNYMISSMLESFEHYEGSGLSWDLIVLIKYQLGVLNSEYDLKNNKNDQRRQAMLIAVTLATQGKKPSYRKIAAKMGVQPSTVMRWFPDNSIISEARKLFGDLQNLKVLERRTKRRK